MTGREGLERLVRIVRRFKRVRLLVVGDLMLDQFIWGRVERISPEAPVPVVHVNAESFHLGGAANAVANVRTLGAAADVVGVIGGDAWGKQLLEELRASGASADGVVRARELPTTRKTRIIAHHQQVVRLDRETPIEDERLLGAVRRRVRARLGDVDGVLVSDYAKGVIHARLLTELADAGVPVFVDPKRGNFENYRGARLMKPNRDAASLASGIEIVDEPSLAAAGERLLEAWQAESVLLSRGEEGMSLFRRDGETRHFPTVAREVYDVTGAGDTVLTTASLAIAAGATLEEAAMLANHAAGIVVGKIGTATVTPDELVAELRRSLTKPEARR